jgi:hypothetical protein
MHKSELSKKLSTMDRDEEENKLWKKIYN